MAIAGVRFDTFLDLLVLIREFLGFLDQLFDLLLRQAALVVCDGDLLTLASALVFSTKLSNSPR